jgi:D-3-phosphoglycerate dehydrogenase
MKKGVRVLNCARGGIIQEKDLLEALNSGQVSAAALDVYETEPLPREAPLRAHPNVIMTPHLGASTDEAQDNVGLEVAEAITDYLLHGAVRNAVNLPNLDSKTYAQMKPYCCWAKLRAPARSTRAQAVDRIFIPTAAKRKVARDRSVTRSILRSFLEFSAGKDINYVNVRSAAAGRGILVEEKSDEAVRSTVAARGGLLRQQQGFCGRHLLRFAEQSRIVRVFSQPSRLSFRDCFHDEQSGSPGHGGHRHPDGQMQVNIAGMSLHRDQAAGRPHGLEPRQRSPRKR